MAVRFTGPVLNRERLAGDADARAWFSNLPVGISPDHVVYFNDFLMAQDYAGGDWVVTETDSGATEALAADELNGALLITNTAGATDVVQLQSAEEWFKLSSGKRAWFETKLKLSEVTEIAAFVGFCTTDTTVIAGTTDSVGFRTVDGSAALTSLTEDNTTETTNTVATLVDATYVTLGFYWDGISRVYFFVNRSLKATHSTNIEQTNKLALTLCVTNGEAVAKTLTVDYLYAAMER